jgi:hypothetical protein
MSVSPPTTVVLREGAFRSAPALERRGPAQQRDSNRICQAHQGDSRDAPQRDRSVTLSAVGTAVHAVDRATGYQDASSLLGRWGPNPMESAHTDCVLNGLAEVQVWHGTSPGVGSWMAGREYCAGMARRRLKRGSAHQRRPQSGTGRLPRLATPQAAPFTNHTLVIQPSRDVVSAATWNKSETAPTNQTRSHALPRRPHPVFRRSPSFTVGGGRRK